MCGSTVSTIPPVVDGNGVPAIGPGPRMWARIGSDRDMRAAAITEVIGNEVAATRTATLTAAS